MKNQTVIVLAVLCLVFTPILHATEWNVNPTAPISVVGSIYSEIGAPQVESLNGWGNYLYLSVRHNNGDQKLEVWNVQDPNNPVQTQTIDYGNLFITPSAHWKFPTVNVFDNTIVVRSNFMDYVYAHDPSGELQLLATHDFSSSVGEIIGEASMEMSSAGSYASFFGRLFEPYDALPEEEFGHVILNFTNPLRPFYSTSVHPLNEVQLTAAFAGHLNAVIQNVPGHLKINDDHTLLFSGRKIQSQTYLDVVWVPHFEQIFNPGILLKTVEEQIDFIVKQPAAANRFAQAIDLYYNALEIAPEYTIADAIEAGSQDAESLMQLLDQYGIAASDSVCLAINKVVAYHISSELDDEISKILFIPILNQWTDDLLNIPILSSEGMHEAISLILNEGISQETVARFLLDRYITPLLEDHNADWLTWNLQQLVDEVSESEAGQAVSALIGTAHDTIYSGDLLGKILDLVPNDEQFELFTEFPKDCRQLLEYSFFENGAKLNREGLAFMELLKFYQYYSGNDDYLNYDAQFSEAIVSLQGDLAGSVAETIEPFLSAQTYIGDFQQRVETFVKEFSSKTFISQAISEAICGRLELQGIDTSLTVREVLTDNGLFLSLEDVTAGAPFQISDVQDLIDVLEIQYNEAQTSVQTLWNEGQNYFDHYIEAGRRILLETVKEAWGEIDPDHTLLTVIQEYLGNHIDSKWTFGDSMDGLLEEYVYSAIEEYPGFLDYLELVKRAEDGDIIARWQLTLKIAKEVAALVESTQSLSMTCETLETTLEETFKEAMANGFRALLYEYASTMMSEMFGSHAAWVSRTEALNFHFDVRELTSIDPVRSVPFTWESSIGFVARESWDFINPRDVSLVLFDPGNPEKTIQEIVFDDEWGGIDYVHSDGGIVMIGGTQYDGIWPTPTAFFFALGDEEISLFTVRDAFLAGSVGIKIVNHGENLVLHGPGGVYLLPNPHLLVQPEGTPDTRISSWSIY